MTTKLAENLARIRADIEACAAASNVLPPLLVGVSKTVGPNEIRTAHGAGLIDFGENRLQDYLTKIEQLHDLTDIRWHFIGPLQRNKVRKLLKTKPALIHSVDSLRLAETIDRIAREESLSPVNVLIEVNVVNEAGKHGFSVAAIHEEASRLVELTHVRIQGCMTMAPFTDDTTIIDDCFTQTRKLVDSLSKRFGAHRFGTTCSMGMTNDYHVAIRRGATIVRIGSALFHGE